MEITDAEMDALVLNAVRELVRELAPNFPDRDRVQRRVLEHLSDHIDHAVVVSLKRLEDREQIEADRDTDVRKGRPFYYWLPKTPRRI
jgi:hypothetical protein